MPSKKTRLQLYADECFPLTSVTYLKSKGISVVHAFDRNLIGKTDRFHLKESKKLERTLITIDRDFIFYETTSLRNHPGIIIISTGSATAPSVNNICDKALSKITPEYTKDSLIRITRSKIIRLKTDRRSEIKL